MKISVALIAISLMHVVSIEAQQPVLIVPQKEIPVPAGLSPELQKVVEQPVSPKTAMPTTLEGWKELQKSRDAEGEKRARATIEAVGAKVEPTTIAGVPCFRITPKQVSPENAKRLIYHIHGGAFVFFGGIAGVGEGVLLADAAKTEVISVDYRRPPDHPFPAASDDALAVWRALAAEHDPKKIAMGGTSAGGGLVLTTVLRAKELGLPKPAALFVGTPAADLTKTGDTMFTNAEIDHVLGRYEGRIEECLKLYAAGRDLKEPLLSPIYGDLSSFPPTILITGTRDLLLSATIKTHRKLRSAGVTADLHVYEGQSHADYLNSFPGPESRDSLSEIAQFFDRHLGK